MSYTTITIKRFRDPTGQPTCCSDFLNGDFCRYFGTRRLGTVDVCLLGENKDLKARTTGFQRPHADCEVWADVLQDKSAHT